MLQCFEKSKIFKCCQVKFKGLGELLSKQKQQTDDVVRIVLPFRDQQSANVLRKQLGALSRKINIAIEPVFKSHKLQDEFRSNEPKPNIINQQCVVYEFQCPLCDARYVGYTTRHLFQRIEEHRLQSSSIGKHLKSHHPVETAELTSHFKILKKCRGKLECLIFEMLLIKELNPSLNKQSDSIKAKVFIQFCLHR